MEPFEIITESIAITLYYGYTKFKNIFLKIIMVRLIKILKNMLFLLMQDIQKLLLF